MNRCRIAWMISAAPLPTKDRLGSAGPEHGPAWWRSPGFATGRAPAGPSFLGRITSAWKCIKNSLVA